MKLIVERSGGFAGLVRRGQEDLAALSAEQRAALKKLLDAGASLVSPSPGADRFTFKIEVHDEHGTRSLTIPETAMPESLAAIATAIKD